MGSVSNCSLTVALMFVPDEFQTFNGMRHIQCAPYHLSSNGAAEQFIATFSRLLPKIPALVAMSILHVL